MPVSESPHQVVWRAIPIAPDYEASDVGDIRNRITRRVLKPWLAGAGYRYVQLGARGPKTSIHRLVAMAFHGLPPEGKPEVAHYDGNPLNNRPANLRWASRTENVADQRRHGTLDTPRLRGSAHGRAKLVESDVLQLREMSRAGALMDDLTNRFGVSRRTIENILTNSTWKHLS